MHAPERRREFLIFSLLVFHFIIKQAELSVSNRPGKVWSHMYSNGKQQTPERASDVKKMLININKKLMFVSLERSRCSLLCALLQLGGWYIVDMKSSKVLQKEKTFAYEILRRRHRDKFPIYF